MRPKASREPVGVVTESRLENPLDQIDKGEVPSRQRRYEDGVDQAPADDNVNIKELMLYDGIGEHSNVDWEDVQAEGVQPAQAHPVLQGEFGAAAQIREDGTG